MVTEAIILAGGLGTRLRSAVPDLPKCMAPINQQPFLKYIITDLQKKGIIRFIFALGYLHQEIEQFLEASFPEIEKQISIEEEPLGTGGGIQLAINHVKNDAVLIVNGDTYFDIHIQELYQFHAKTTSWCTLALKKMLDFDRYGVVETDENGLITNFKEKQWYSEGLINGGIYLLNVQHFKQLNFPEKFSFEKQFLEAYCSRDILFGLVQDGYFIDIGIPSDYEKAQVDFLQLF